MAVPAEGMRNQQSRGASEKRARGNVNGEVSCHVARVKHSSMMRQLACLNKKFILRCGMLYPYQIILPQVNGKYTKTAVQ
eukprot:scaffold100244_cov26-Prasinocladus_malaysianus.AAC.1